MGTISTIPLARLISALLLLFFYQQSFAETLHIAVASNFTRTLHLLAEDFASKTGHEVRISSASTGKLYAQIKHGAPFDVLLAADDKRPELLIAEGKASTNMSRTYAFGQLVFLSNIQTGTECIDVLQSSLLKRLAIANPGIAPYGTAARQVLKNLGQWDKVKTRLVMGENIAQTLQFVSTGNATAGFVARSLLIHGTNIKSACEWLVPENLYNPIKQKMVVLNRAANNSAATDFWIYMYSNEAKQIITNSGYESP